MRNDGITHATDYAKSAMRFYARNLHHPGSIRLSTAQVVNWKCVERTLKEFSRSDRELLIALYEADDSFTANVQYESMIRDVPQSKIWAINSRFLRRFIKNRGLA